MGVSEAVQKLQNGLIVSCQAPAGSPLNRPAVIAAIAQAAERAGAMGVRIDGARNIRSVRRATTLPIIGIEKLRFPSSPVYITPTLPSIRRVHVAGADIIAIDGTVRNRPAHHSLEQAMDLAKRELGALVMADVATVEEGLHAVELGADLVSTTLSGYTDDTQNDSEGPAFDLLQKLVEKVGVAVVLEGRVRTPEEVRRAFELGAHAVVVGTAITGIEWLTREFAKAALRAQACC